MNCKACGIEFPSPSGRHTRRQYCREHDTYAHNGNAVHLKSCGHYWKVGKRDRCGPCHLAHRQEMLRIAVQMMRDGALLSDACNATGLYRKVVMEASRLESLQNTRTTSLSG